MKHALILFFGLILSGCVTVFADLKLMHDYEKVNRINNSVVALVVPTSSTVAELGIQNNPNEANSLYHDHSSYCSGFFISETQVLTAAHCINDVSGFVKITTYYQYINDANPDSYYLQTYHIFKLKNINTVTDLALLEALPNQDLGEHSFLELGRIPGIGDRVYTVGHPGNNYWSVTQGIISHILRRYSNGYTATQTTALSFYGNSGGPLIDSDGNAIGVCNRSASIPTAYHLVLFSYVETIRKFLE